MLVCLFYFSTFLSGNNQQSFLPGNNQQNPEEKVSGNKALHFEDPRKGSPTFSGLLLQD